MYFWEVTGAVLSVHAPSEEKSVDSKDSFHEELGQVFEHFPKYHMKFLLGDFNAIMEMIFSNRKLGKRIHIRIVIIMLLE